MHQCIFHILPDFGYQVNIIDKKFLKQVFRDITFVGQELSEDSFIELLVFERLYVIYVSLDNKKLNNLSFNWILMYN